MLHKLLELIESENGTAYLIGGAVIDCLQGRSLS